MASKISIGSDGTVGRASNVPYLPRLQISTSTRLGRRLVRLHKLLSGDAPHICIKRGEGIGDLLMSTPVARFIIEQYPRAIVTYATNLNYLNGALPAVLQHNPYVHSVVDWDAINDSEYDAVLDLHCPCVSHEQPRAAPINRIDLFARHVGITHLSNPRPVYVSLQQEVDEARVWLNNSIHVRQGDQVVVVNPFASNQQRSVDPALMRNVIGLFRNQCPSVKVIVVTHTSDFTNDFSWQPYAHAVAKDWPIRKIAALMQCCNLIICPDSALLHMAGALDIPAVGIFGPTDARARVNHYPRACGLWPGMSLSCAPCWYTSGQCHHKTCWKMIHAQDIFDLSMAVLSDKNIQTGGHIIQAQVNSTAQNASAIPAELV